MAEVEVVTKRVAISKANAQVVVVVSVAAFIVVFCLTASHALIVKNIYQSKVLSIQNKAKQQLSTNIQAYSSLSKSYQSFISTPNNVIGGSSTGSTGNNNGSNASIIIDALPSSYDFPALTSSIENILTARGLQIASISGTDDQLSEQTNNSSPDPQPVEMPFSFSVSNINYAQVGQLITALGQSIRPISIDTVDLTGSDSDMTLTVNAHTYYQPGKTVDISTQAVAK
jgi:hypothetical protein